ncbi:MAG: PLxRFG domain-containing protein, partial [Desulfohalobiaceae bacterium]
IVDGESRGEFTGVDLKVGGAGQRTFYDQILPSMLNKYVKKWGAKVGDVEIESRNIGRDRLPSGAFGTMLQAPSIPITNQMRKDVLTRGQPLFVAERSGTLEGYPEYPDAGQYRPREFARALGQWREKLQDWVKTAPDLLKFERAADHVRVVSRNTYPEGKPWRVTDFRKQDGQWVPTGHAERNSKSEAVEEAAQNARLAPEISFDALHDLAAESRAAPPTVQQVQEWIQPLQDAPGQVLPVNVVQGVQDLPQHLQERAQEIQGVPKAVLDRSAGQVTLIADNIADQKDAVLKWMHEQAGHYGFERMLGNNAVRHVLGSVRLIYGRSGLQDIMDVYGDDMHVAAREKFARIVEKVYAGEPLQRKERTIWQKFVDAVRNWLRARGIPVALSERELADLARSAIQYAQTGQIPPQAQAYSRAVQRGTQPRAQAPAMAPQAQAAIDLTEQFASEENMGREHEEQVRQENPQRTKRTDQALGRERFDVQSMRQELQEDPELRSFLRNMFARRRGDPEVITTDLDRQDLSLLEEQIGVPYWLSKRFPVFRRIFDIHQSRLEERVEMQKDFMHQIQNPLSLRGKDLEHYRELVWFADGRQLVDVPLMQQKLDNQGRPVYEAGRPVLEINEAHYQALQQEMDRAAQEGGFSKDAVQAFMDTRRALDRAWLEVYDRMRKRSDVDDSSIEELRTWINRVHNYFPHHRYGRFYVQGYGKNQLEKTRQSWRVVSPLGEVLRSFKDKASAESWLEKNPRSVAYRAHFDVPLERMAKRKGQKLAKQAKQEYPDLDFEVGKNARLSEDIYAYPIPLEAIEQVLRAAKDRVKDADLQLELDKVMPGAVSDVLKSRGWAGHMIKRKNVPGYETKDVQRVLYDYFSGLAGWLTKMEAASQFSDALRDARQDAKRYPRLYQYSARYVRDMLENADRLDTVVDAYRSAVFIKYLGGVIKTGVLNLTQNPVAGVPALGTHIGQTRAHRRFFPQAARTVVNTAIKKAGGKEILSQDEAQMLDSLYRKGITDSLWLKEIRGSIGSRYGNYWDKFTSFMGYPVAVSDRFNRMSLALAAYRAARSGEITNPDTLRNLGLEKGQAATPQQAERFAREVVLDSHFVYGKGNRPQIIRGSGRAFSPLYSFRHFLHNLLSLYGHFFRDLSRNNLQGARALATSFGWTAALGGLTSLPLYQTLQAAMAFLFDEDETWAERMRDQIPDMPSGRPDMLRDMATYGLPSAAGVTFGGSLSIETPITRSLKPGSSMEEIVKDSLFNAGGAGLDLFFSPFRALSYQTSGDTSRALEEVAPGFMRNLLRTYRLTQEGTMSKSGQPLNLPWETGPRKLDSWEAVGQALGFQPLSSTKSWDVMQSLQLSRGVRRRTQQRLADNIIRALRDGDQERAGQYVRQWEQWNQRAAKEKKPWLKISDESLSRSLRARATDMNFPKRDLPRAAKLLQSYKD